MKKKKPPGFLLEISFITVNICIAKFYSDLAFDALSFVTVLLPFMLYFLVGVVTGMLRFITSLSMEDIDDEIGILSPK